MAFRPRLDGPTAQIRAGLSRLAWSNPKPAVRVAADRTRPVEAEVEKGHHALPRP